MVGGPGRCAIGRASQPGSRWAGSPAASSPTGPKQNAPTAGRAAGQRQRRRRAGRHLASPRPGRQRHFTLGLSLAQSWPSSPGRTVAGFSAALPKLNAQPADHVRTRVLKGTSALCRTAQPGGVLAADSCGCGSAGEGGTLGVPHRVALHQIRQHAPGAVGGPARGRARGHPARGPADPHPGMRGNRGPSWLSWAILTGASRWGLTMVRVEPATRPEELGSAGEGLLRTDRLGHRHK
jgi:hypothetical protein